MTGPTVGVEADVDPAEGTPLDPRMVWVWTVIAGLAAAVVLLPLGVIAVVAGGGAVVAGFAAVALVVVAAVVVLPRLWYRRWRYHVGISELELRHGVVVRTHSVLPYYRVQHIDVTQGPIDRLMGLSRLVVHTASAGSDKVIPGVASDRAEHLRKTILARTGAGDAV